MKPPTHLSDDVGLETGMSASPLNSWNAAGLGRHDTK